MPIQVPLARRSTVLTSARRTPAAAITKVPGSQAIVRSRSRQTGPRCSASSAAHRGAGAP